MAQFRAPPAVRLLFPITLTNDGLISIAGVGIDIAYNSQYLTPIDATIGPAGQAAGKGIAENIVSPGLYRVLVFSTSNMTNIGNGILANVAFGIDCAAPATTYTLGNTPSSSTAEGIEVPTDGSDGAIQVGQGSSSTTTTTIAAVRPPEEHIVSCLVCHEAAIHTPVSHTSNCAGCHIEGDDNSPQPNNCIACHPVGNIGTCNLVNFHDPGKSTTCLSCHVDCNAPTSDDHIKQCLPCHPTSFSSTDPLRMHSRSGHSTCSQCHDGTPAQGNVTADKCSVCHPLGNTGQCKIVDLHSPNIISTCLTCHMNCAGGGAATTTTTTASGSTTTTTTPGGSTTTTTVSGTTTIPTEHYSVCRTCHYSDDVHAVSSHNVCSTCHSGAPGAGNVSASACIVCHPNGDPGDCNLVKYHGSTCISCHTASMCANPSGTHIDMCLNCHYVNDIHAKSAHQNCAICHSSVPKKGNVSPGDCVVCHPLSQSGKCNLIQDSNHTNTCSTCHITCTGNTVITTTTTLPPGSCQILRISPVNGVKIGFGLLPRIAKITVTTNTDLKSIGIIDCDLKFENHPRGIHILHSKVIGSAIEATVLFVAVQPGPYSILLGECGSTSITLSRFWEFP